jgi:hypothetical protein
MADRLYGDVVADSTSVSVAILLRNKTDNNPTTGVPPANVVANYYRQGGVSVVPITATLLGARNDPWVSGGWNEIHPTQMPGWYRFDLPNAAFVSGADFVALHVEVPLTFGFDVPYRIQSSALIPDQILKRDFASVEATSPAARRSLMNAIRLLLNRWVTTPTTITVMKEDDTTPAWTGSLSTATGAAQITSVDPA